MLLSFLGLKASGLRRSQAFFIFLRKFFRHSFQNLRRFLIAFLLLVCFVVFLFNRNNFYLENCQVFLSDFTSKALYHLQAPFIFFKNHWQTHTSLQQKIRDLILENQQLKLFHHQLLNNQRENEQLRKLLNALPAYNQEFLTTRVLCMPTDSFSTLVIENGPEKNLTKNQVVITGEGVIGRLYQVGEKTARVLLITDSRSKIPARIARTGEHIILAGQNNDQLEVLHTASSSLMFNDQPKIGDLLITSGLGGIYPPNLPLARISYVKEGQFTARILADINTIDYVSVFKNVIPYHPIDDQKEKPLR